MARRLVHDPVRLASRIEDAPSAFATLPVERLLVEGEAMGVVDLVEGEAMGVVELGDWQLFHKAFDSHGLVVVNASRLLHPEKPVGVRRWVAGVPLHLAIGISGHWGERMRRRRILCDIFFLHFIEIDERGSSLGRGGEKGCSEHALKFHTR